MDTGDGKEMTGKRAIKPVGRIPNNYKDFENFGKELYSNIEDVCSGVERALYARVITQIDKDEKIFQISLITDYMIKRDKAFIETVKKADMADNTDNISVWENVKGYHPYFLEFYTDPIKSPNVRFLNSLKGTWVEAKLISSDVKTPISDNNDVIIRGTLVFGASRSRERHMQLLITRNKGIPEISIDRMWEELKSGEYKAIAKIIQDNWLLAFQNINNLKCTIYNVGQGNCVLLQDGHGTESFFDVGLSVRYSYNKPISDKDVYDNSIAREKTFINRVRKKLSLCKPKWIMLSHWHDDHLLGIGDINEDDSGCVDPDYNVYSHCYWIAPHVALLKKKPRDFLIRLAYYLLANHTLWLVNSKEREISVEKTSDGRFSLWQGTLIDYKGKSDGQVANDTGIILQIHNENEEQELQDVLFLGDCSFEQIPANVKAGKFRLFVTSHHGSKETVPDLLACKDAQAIVSVGNNCYKHPSPQHMAKLLADGFDIAFTLGCHCLETDIRFGHNIGELTRVK